MQFAENENLLGTRVAYRQYTTAKTIVFLTHSKWHFDDIFEQVEWRALLPLLLRSFLQSIQAAHHLPHLTYNCVSISLSEAVDYFVYSLL